MSSVVVAPLPPAELDDVAGQRRAEHLAWAFVVLGVVVRVGRYLLRFPLWGDEVMLADNFLDRGYAELAGGLAHTQVAPVGYLWLERLLLDLFGFNEFALRGVAIAAGVAALIVFRIAAGHVLRGWPLVVAVGAMAVAYYPIRHAAEVKPYACDLFAAVLLIEPFLAWLGKPERTDVLWRLVPAALIALPLSFTAAFVAGGVSLAVACEPRRRGAASALTPWVAFNLAVLAVFAFLYWVALRHQFDANGAKMQWHWEAGFPPSITQPIACLLWFLEVHSGEALAYPMGGDHGGSVVQMLLAVVGAMVCWRTGRRGVVVLTAMTLTVGLVACLLHRYPYGYGERLQQYWGPFVCLLLGQGAASSIAALRHLPTQRRLTFAVPTVLACLGVGLFARDLTHPYKSWLDYENREFSRWFWRYADDGEPLVDLADDLHVPLFDQHEALTFRVNKYLSGRRPPPLPNGTASSPHPTIAADGRTVRCVAFGRHGTPIDEERFAAWTAAMARDYQCVDERQYHLEIEQPGQRATYYVWRFEPRTSQAQLPVMLRR